jgi:hypothetical protein
MTLCATLAVLLIIGGVEKNPGSVVEAEKFCKFCVAGAAEISNRELNITRVDGGTITAVVIIIIIIIIIIY